jgi:hypothetical protein
MVRMLFRYGPANGLQDAIVDPQTWVKKKLGMDGLKADPAVGGMAALEFVGFIMGIFLQWVLEVLGAGGASWGMSEVWNLRADNTSDPAVTNHNYRWVANVIFVMGIFRMAQKYCPAHDVHEAMLSPQAWLKKLETAPAAPAGQNMQEMTAVQDRA